MSPWMNVAAESDDARYRDALKFICDGMCVGFDDFDLAVSDGVLRIGVYLREYERTPECAIRLAHIAYANVTALLKRPDYCELLGNLPRQTMFVPEDDHTPIVLGYLSDDGAFVEPKNWRGPR